MPKKEVENKKTDTVDEKAAELKVNWDASKMKTSYANVVNANSTREEVSVFFGTNQSWGGADTKQLTIPGGC